MGIEKFDIYRKVPKDLSQATQTGALISICSCIFISFLLISEFLTFIQSEVVTELYVDDPSSGAGPIHKIPVSIKIKIPEMSCKYLGVDIQDEAGRHEVGFLKNTKRENINANKGCLFSTNFHIAKVPGNFHISTHSSVEQPQNPDMAHEIIDLHFGEEVDESYLQALPTTINTKSFSALKGHKTLETVPRGSTFDYTLRIVPTVIDKIDGKRITTYQYTYAYKDFLGYMGGRKSTPASWFRYEISPLTVKYTQKRQPFYRFITTICAVIGGTFTVAGILDSMIFGAQQMVKKAQIGKLS